MSIGAQRNKPCTCGSGLKYKKCHLPKIMGFLPSENAGYIDVNSITGTEGLDLVLKDLKDAVDPAKGMVLRATFPYIVMPYDWWINESKRFGVFNYTESEINKATHFKSGFIGGKFGVECYITRYAELTKEKVDS